MQILPGERQSAGYDVELARKLGLNAAIILSRIIWSIESKMEGPDKNKRFFIDGKWWMYDSILDLQTYSGLSRHQVMAAIKLLEFKELILISTHGGFDRRKWYTTNDEKIINYLSSTAIKPDARRKSKQPIKGPIVEKFDDGSPSPLSNNSIVEKFDDPSSNNSTMQRRIIRQCNVEKFDDVTNSLSEDLTKVPRGGEPIVEKFDNGKKVGNLPIKTFRQLFEEENGKGDRPPKPKKAPPDEVIKLGDTWFDWIDEKLPTHDYRRSEFYAALEEILALVRGDIDKVRQLFGVVQNDHNLSRRFHSPMLHREIFGGMTVLQDALLKINLPPKAQPPRNGPKSDEEIKTELAEYRLRKQNGC